MQENFCVLRFQNNRGQKPEVYTKKKGKIITQNYRVNMEDFKATILELMKMQFKQQQKNEQRQTRLKEKQLEIQQKTEEKQLELQELLLWAVTNKGQNSRNEATFLQNAIWSSIKDFSYAPDEDKTFAAYFRRYEDSYEFAGIGQMQKKYVYY